ncbi:MAG: chemotaxis protein CheX [Desulfobacteraceae bacterium]
MPEKIDEALSRVAVETFEKLAFLLAFPEDDALGEEMGDTVSGSVVFTGPFSGILKIRISSAVLPELTANMLGLEDEAKVALDDRHDALKETVNVICGNLLPVIAGREPIFNMETPVILSKEEDRGRQALSTVRLSFDEGECEISIYVDGELPKEVLDVE